MALGGREFLHSGDLGCCHREAGWKVLERQVRQAVGQACDSRKTKPQVLRRWQSELSGLQSLLFVERCGEGRKPKNKVPEALHFQETWRASLDAPRVPGDSGCCLEHRAGLTPQTRSLPRHTHTHTHTQTHTHTHTPPTHTHTHTHSALGGKTEGLHVTGREPEAPGTTEQVSGGI